MPADPRRVKDLFGAAAAIADPQARDAFLDSECRDDPELRRRLRDLLRAHDHPESALERPLAVAAGPASTSDHGPARGAVGSVVAGRYKLLELIGEGGMGEVWVADQQDSIKRRVALKMIKPGMDSRSILARFEAERQALALMDHPNIAKVLDAGTTNDGRPYFVMELVKGTPITEFCDARKLSPRERLKLFVPVCQAIQHAHTKGIIHRDIKPTNVLVALHDETAVPKVIDFGVAKAVGQQLTEKTLYTGFGALVGTPAYMAPEQATFNQLDVDTRADVYALGVLLYELLAGSPPFEPERLKQAALDEVLRLVREEEPPKPSQRLSTSQAKATIAATRQSDPDKLAKLIRGELDWIVMKSLEKDRNRRYESAAGLARDVERYLADEPVEACPPTLGYRLRKAYRRHRAAVIVAAIFVGVLVVATAVSLTYASLADRAIAVAEDSVEVSKLALADAEKQKKEAETKAQQVRDANEQLRQAGERQLDDQYVWDMQLLPLAFDANNVAEVNRLLDRHLPQPGRRDRRGFEWYFWDRRLRSDLSTGRLPDADGPRGVWSASPDGARVARFIAPRRGEDDAPYDSPALTVWDVASRKVLLKHRMPIKPADQSFVGYTPNFPVFSKDGTRVAVEWAFFAQRTPGSQRLRQVLDVATGKELLRLDGNQGGPSVYPSGEIEVAFSQDGRRFAAVGPSFRKADQPGFVPSQVRVWDLESGKEVCPALDAEALADGPFSPDGTLLVTRKSFRTGSRVSVWNLADGKEKVGWHAQDRGISALVFSPDGKLVAAALAGRPPTPADPNPPSESQTGKIWSLETKRELSSLTFPALPGTDLRHTRVFFSPDGSRLAVERSTILGGTGRTAGDLSVWDTASLKSLPSPAGLDFGGTVLRGLRGPTFSPDGKQFVGTEGNVLRTWDVETGKPVLTLRGHVTPIIARGYSPDGTRLWSLDSGSVLKEWDVRPADEVVIRFAAPKDLQMSSSLAVSPEAGRFASVVEAADGPTAAPYAVRVWDAAGKAVGTLAPPPRAGERPARGAGALDDLALSRDGRRAALTRPHRNIGLDKSEPAAPADLTVWDVESKTVLFNQKLEGKHPPFVAIAPDGRTVAVTTRADAREAAVRLFDVDGRRERPPLAADSTSISGIGFSPDGRRLAGLCVNFDPTTGKSTTRLGVWDVQTAERLCTLDAEADAITYKVLGQRLAWAPDGSRFAFANGRGGESVLTVHDTATGKHLLTLDQPLAAESGSQYLARLAYSPDGRRIAALLFQLGGTPVLKLWDAASGKELLSLRVTGRAAIPAPKRLSFTADGLRLRFAELVSDPPPPGAAASPGRSLALTTWDATPVPEREPRKP